jgi:beta-glucosidase
MKPNRVVILFGLLLLTGAVLNLSVDGGQTSAPPYQNPALPIEKRVDDLVSRMTLEEKVSQMMNAAQLSNVWAFPHMNGAT